MLAKVSVEMFKGTPPAQWKAWRLIRMTLPMTSVQVRLTQWRPGNAYKTLKPPTHITTPKKASRYRSTNEAKV